MGSSTFFLAYSLLCSGKNTIDWNDILNICDAGHSGMIVPE
jgi:hypothetical protein